MNCEISNSIVRISSVNTLMDSLTADDFLRVAIYKLKNANISTWGHHYDITFLDSSTGTGSVVSTGQVSTPYRISPTPLNIQFNDITVASQKFFVLNRYQFSMETVNGEDIQINGDSRIGILITFPDEYKKIWETIDKPSKVYITFGSTDYGRRIGDATGGRSDVQSSYDALDEVHWGELGGLQRALREFR